VDREELQIHRPAVTIIVPNVSDVTADSSGDSKLLVQFARQGLFGGFALLNLAPWELPLQCHRLIGAALAN
jgi:hypothetical protein